MPSITLGELASHLGARLEGDAALRVERPAGLAEAGPGDLSFLANPKYAPQLAATRATAVIVGPGSPAAPCALLRVDQPDLAFGLAVGLLCPPPPPPPAGVHPRASVDPSAKLGPGVSVGPGAVVEAGAVIGERTILHALAFVGRETELGPDCEIFPGAVLYPRVRLGARVRVHANAVIGSDGFGYAWDGKRHAKIPQAGTVEIGDDVEIGACTTIDRARFGATGIGAGTKLDNQIQIAHNVRLGPHCVFAAQVGVSGSTRIGGGAMVGGQSGFSGHLEIGDRAAFSARCGVTKSLPGGRHYSGYPARPHELQLEEWRHLKALPRLRETVRALLRRLGGGDGSED